jgi:hypothetical protein
MSNDQIDYDAIRRRVQERLNKRKEFIAHFAAYIMTNLTLWILYFLVEPNTLWILIPIMSTLGWGIGLVIHGSVVFFESGGMDAWQEREMQKEIARERMRRGLPPEDGESWEKPKRDRIMRLTDDGELIEDEDRRKQHSQN